MKKKPSKENFDDFKNEFKERTEYYYNFLINIDLLIETFRRFSAPNEAFEDNYKNPVIDILLNQAFCNMLIELDSIFDEVSLRESKLNCIFRKNSNICDFRKEKSDLDYFTHFSIDHIYDYQRKSSFRESVNQDENLKTREKYSLISNLRNKYAHIYQEKNLKIIKEIDDEYGINCVLDKVSNLADDLRKYLIDINMVYFNIQLEVPTPNHSPEDIDDVYTLYHLGKLDLMRSRYISDNNLSPKKPVNFKAVIDYIKRKLELKS